MAVFSVGFITALMTIPNWLFLSALNDFRHSGDEERSGYFHIIPGFSLFDHILSIHYTESSLICGLLCLRNEKCASFNFGRTSDGKFQCELSGSNATQSPMKLKRRISFDYFQVSKELSKIDVTTASNWLNIRGRPLYDKYGQVCAAGTLKLLAYARPHSDAFCNSILDLTIKKPIYPRFAIFRNSIIILVQLTLWTGRVVVSVENHFQCVEP